MARNDMTERLRSWSDAGWEAEKTQNGHWKLRHPEASKVIFAPSTPSDWRSVLNLESEMKRALGRQPTTKREPSKKTYKKTEFSPLFNMYETPTKAAPAPTPVQKPAVVFVQENEKYSREEVAAWGFCYLRMRLENKDLSLIQTLKARFREDVTFATSVIDKYRSTSFDKRARLRIALRNPNRFTGKYVTETPSFIAVPIPVKLSPEELLKQLQIKYSKIESDLTDERMAKKKIEDDFFAYKNSALIEMNELRLKKNLAESVRDDLMSQLSHPNEKPADMPDPRVDRLIETIANLKDRIDMLDRRTVFSPVKPVANKPSPKHTTRPVVHSPVVPTRTTGPILKPKAALQHATVGLKKPMPTSKPVAKISPPVMKSVQRRFNEARMKLDISQTALAKKIGVSGPMVSCWETGKYPISEAKLPAVCKALKVPKNYFD